MEKKLLKKISSYEIIKNSVDNMNTQLSAKYKQTHNEIEKNSLSSEASRERLNIQKLKN